MNWFIVIIGCDKNDFYIGDGYCDDDINKEECQFDGGDCCGVNVKTEFCAKCLCYEHCGAALIWIENEYCNDEANNANCGYDSGECCGACINTTYCTDCSCLEVESSKLDLRCK